jgi:hypothetical protein
MYKVTGFIKGKRVEKTIFADSAKEAVRFYKAKLKAKKISVTVISVISEELLKQK